MVHATYNCQYIDLTAFLLQCYECNSDDEKGSCSDTESGELSRCGPGDKGCFISKGGDSNLIEGNLWCADEDILWTCAGKGCFISRVGISNLIGSYGVILRHIW